MRRKYKTKALKRFEAQKKYMKYFMSADIEFIDKKSIKVQSKIRGLYAIKCPFLVITLIEIKNNCVHPEGYTCILHSDCYYEVLEVRKNRDSLLEYMIEGHFYPHNYFVFEKEVHGDN